MTPNERREKLLAAQELVRAVRDDLEPGVVPCPTCNVPRYTDWQAHLLREALDGVCVKLANAVVRFLPQ